MTLYRDPRQREKRVVVGAAERRKEENGRPKQAAKKPKTLEMEGKEVESNYSTRCFKRRSALSLKTGKPVRLPMAVKVDRTNDEFALITTPRL